MSNLIICGLGLFVAGFIVMGIWRHVTKTPSSLYQEFPITRHNHPSQYGKDDE